MIKGKGNSLNTDAVVEERFRLLMELGEKIPADSDVPDISLPSYYDGRKFELGQKTFYDNVFAMMIAKLAGLISLLAIPSIVDILILTKQSGTPCTAFRRYVSTILHTFIWYEKSQDKNSEFFASIKNVRRKHCVASKRSFDAGLNRISQFDMALTQFGFIGFSLLSTDELGIVASEEEFEGLIHMWRVIGNMLGMEERFNICSGSLKETKALCSRLLDEVFLPRLAAREPNFEVMRNVLLEAMWPINPQIDPAAFTAVTFRLAALATTNNNHSLVIDTSKLSNYSKFLYDFQFFVHKKLINKSKWWAPIFRSIFNTQLRIAIFLTEHWPFLAHFIYGRKRSYVNIYSAMHNVEY